ncbi:MAG: PIG-L deacetylase family protein [Microvirga sp.]
MIRAGDYLRAAQQLPPIQFTDLTRGHGFVVVAPHPDDESLGCGGLIAMASERGVRVRIVLVSDGAGSHPNSPSYPPERLRALREQELAESAAVLGLPECAVTCLRIPDRYVPTAGPEFGRAVDAIRAAALAIAAGSVFVTWRHDPHGDHQATFAIAKAAVAGLENVRLYAYPVWGWILADDMQLDEPAPRGGRLDIRSQLARKRRAIAAHRSQTTNLIDDDPGAFRLESEVLRHFDQPHELFLEVAP